MPDFIQLVYPMGRVVISVHKITCQLNSLFKNARHFKPSEYLSYYKLDSQKDQVSAFPLYVSEDSSKVYMKEYTALSSEISSNSEMVQYSQLSKAKDGACFIVAANYWPVEIHNFPKVCRVPMFFQAQDMTELKLRLITFIGDFGHNKTTLNDCKPFLNLVDLRMTNLERNYEEKDDGTLLKLPVSIKPILHTTCCSVPLLTAEGMLQVSDAPLSTIKQEMENNNRKMVVLDYSCDEGVQLLSEENVRLSECESAPIILKPNEVIFVFTGDFIVSRAEKDCFQNKTKKIAYKVSQDLTPKQIAQFLELNLKILAISEKSFKTSDSKSEIKVKVITTKKDYWKYDMSFYTMVVTNCLGVQTMISEIIALWHYFSNDQLIYAYTLVAFSILATSGRMMIAFLKKELRWYSLFTSIAGVDRMIETYNKWNKFGNKVTPVVNTEIIQLYLQTIISLVLTLIAQLVSNELTWVLCVNTLLSSLSVCMTLSSVHSCFMPICVDPNKNPWDSPLYGNLFEKKYHQDFPWKIKQLIRFLTELISRCLILTVTLIHSPILVGVLIYAYFCLEAIYSLKYNQTPTLFAIIGSISIPPAKSVIARDLMFVSHSQIQHMMKKDLLNPEMLILEKHLYSHILVKTARVIPFIACITYLLVNDNYRSINDACTYATLVGFCFTTALMGLYLYDCLVLGYYARLERKKKFTPLNYQEKNSSRNHNAYKVIAVKTMVSNP